MFPRPLRPSRLLLDRLLLVTLALFIALWPLERRHLVFTEHSFVTGAFTDAATVSVYLSDLAFFALLGAWLLWRRQQPTGENHAPDALRLVPRPLRVALFLFVAWAFLRALPLHPSVLGWFAALRVLQGAVLFLIAAEVFQRRAFRTSASLVLITVAVLQALLIAAQVSNGHDLGLRFVGEPPLSLNTPGVAKVDVVDHNDGNVKYKVLRGYGTFPHPNVTGSFLISSILVSSILLGERFNRNRSAEHSGLRTIALGISLIAVSTGTLLTFSRSAWMALAMIVFFLATSSHFERKAKAYVSTSIFAGLLLPVLLFPSIRDAVYSRFVPPETDKSLAQRAQYIHNSVNTIREHQFLGVGMGNSLPRTVETVSDGTPQKEPHHFDVPHSFPLVLTLELGAAGLAIFSVFGYLLIRIYVVQYTSMQNHWELLIPGFLLPFILFDKFLWTIQQGRILLWGFLGLYLAMQLCSNRNKSVWRQVG